MGYKVSVLIPVYKVENYIERCLRSVCEQDYSNLEIIIVDDYSPDSSMKIAKRIIESYPDRQKQTIFLRHEKNKGLSASRNTAIKKSSGLFLMHLDSDDYLYEGAIRKLVDKQLQTDADIVTGNALMIDNSGEHLMERVESTNKEDFVKSQMDVGLNHTIWGRIIRKELYSEYNISTREGVNMGEDWQVMPQLAYYAKKFAFISDIVYYYVCMNPNSYMSITGVGYNETTLRQQILSVREFCDFFASKEVEYKKYAIRILIWMLYYTARVSYSYRKKNFYYSNIKQIDSYGNSYWDIVGWDSKLNRFVDHHYYIKLLNSAINKIRRYILGS